MNPSKQAVTRHDQLQRAMMIKGTLGTRAAAKYMRKNRWSIEAAMLVLVGGPAVERMSTVEHFE